MFLKSEGVLKTVSFYRHTASSAVKILPYATCAWLALFCPLILFLMVICLWPNFKARVGAKFKCALRMVVKSGKVKDREGVYVMNVVHKELLLQ